MRGNSAIRRPLIILAVCAVAAVGYVARDFLIPTAGADRAGADADAGRQCTSSASGCRRRLAAAIVGAVARPGVAGILSLVIPSIADWAAQAPYLTLTLQRKLEGLRKSLAFMQELTNKVEQATTAARGQGRRAARRWWRHNRSLLGQLASTTPAVILQIAYAGVLAFMLLAHRNSHRRQILRIPASFDTRVRLARMMRDINERVGHYLFSLAVIYAVRRGAGDGGAGAARPSQRDDVGRADGHRLLRALRRAAGRDRPGGAGRSADLRGLAAHRRGARHPDLIHFAESQFVTPAFVSRRCALNTVAVFVTIALLGWMWGAIGAIVAVPLLILISTIAAHLPSLRWLEVLLSDDRPVSRRVSDLPPLASRGYKPTAKPSRQPRRRLVAAK